MDMMTMAGLAAGFIAIVPADEALTFARSTDGKSPHLILVSDYDEGSITGADLTAMLGDDITDPIAAYTKYGYDALAALADGRPRVTVPLAGLDVPVVLQGSHIAVGTNFPEHAKESSVTEGPFLFPKDVAPTKFNAPISKGDALLDYEVELCFVTLTDTDISQPVERMGLTLCNDVTDRARLMHHIDPSDVTSGKGFTTGKSAPGYMPLGNLFIIPRDLREFLPKIELRLYRNGDLKQAANQMEAIWDFDELLRQTLTRQTLTWDYQGAQVGLPITDNIVPARTGILAGTPDGTIFKGVNKSAYALGVLDWLLGGWSKSIPHWVFERHIAQEKRARTYLQSGETVHIKVDYLGELKNPITY